MAPGVVDAHAHVYPVDAWGHRRLTDHAITEYGLGAPQGAPVDGAGDLGSLERAMLGSGVADVIAFALYEPARVTDDVRDLHAAGVAPRIDGPGGYLEWLNDWICTVADGRPWFHPVVAADPSALPGSRLVAHIESCIERGAVGVKLHHGFARMAPWERRWWPLYRACELLAVPLVCHSGSTVPLAWFGPVMDRFPNLRLVLAHSGGAGWRHAPGFSRRYPSVAFDLAELLWWVGAPGAPDATGLRGLITDIGADRVLFGSDFPWYQPAHGLSVLRGVGLPDESLRAVTHDTPSTWFGLPGGEARPLTGRHANGALTAKEDDDNGHLQ
jgi:predicted TIM-barrel fold metal-dependent hydrolase